MGSTDIAKELGLELNTDYKSNKDIEKLFKERQDDQIQLLKEGISDIQNMIKERESLSKELLKNLEKVILFIDNNTPKLAELQRIDPRGDLIKEMLKKKVEIEELKLAESLNVWRDIAMLKKELREHMKEYRDLQSKTSMLDNMLE